MTFYFWAQTPLDPSQTVRPVGMIVSSGMLRQLESLSIWLTVEGSGLLRDNLLWSRRACWSSVLLPLQRPF